jgi:methylase of polypeptide subunit release factors
MKLRNPIDYIYDIYARDKLFLIRGFNYFTSSKLIARYFFGVDLSHITRQYLFDMTTVLLRQVLRPRIDSNMDILEIGVGKFAILSISLSKSCNIPINGVDISNECVENAINCVARNKARVTIWQSDIFSRIPLKKYDIIFWNLPYLGPMWGVASGYDRINYLHPLFNSTPDYLKEDGILVIGFNGHKSRITLDSVLEILDKYKNITLTEIRKWTWNRHYVLIIKKRKSQNKN